MNKTSNMERSNWKSMYNTLHPINIWVMFGWRKIGEIYVKWRNCLKRKGRGKRSLTTKCSLVKYIMLFGRSTDDRALTSISWIGMVSGIRKQAQNSHSNRTPTGRSGLRWLTLVFFYPPCWGLPLAEVTLCLSIRLNGSGSCGNLCDQHSC